MALSYPDSRWRRSLLGALTAVAATLLVVEPALAASYTRDPIDWKAQGGFSLEASDVMTLNRPEVRQGSTFLRAAKATATGLDNGVDNSTWKFTDDVHLEFDGAVLDAQAATVVFVNGQLSSVVVQAAAAQQAKKPVHLEFNSAVLDVDTATVVFADGRINTIQAQGAPAQFSHVLKKNGRRAQGRANRIEYDAGKSLVTLSVDTSFSTSLSTGTYDFKTQVIAYNLADGSYRSPEPASGSYSPGERVPAPRTPDRATAK